MFIGTEQNSIKQFFSDIGFLPPKGMDLDYFILPPGSDVESIAPPREYAPEDIQTNQKRGTTLVYQPKDTSKVHAEPKELNSQQFLPTPLPYTPTREPNFGLVGSDGQAKRIMSPEVKNRIVVVETTRDHLDLRLKESLGKFPKGTFFHFKSLERF